MCPSNPSSNASAKPSRPSPSPKTVLPGGYISFCLRSRSRLLFDAINFCVLLSLSLSPLSPAVARRSFKLSRSCSNAKQTCAHPSAKDVTITGSLPTSINAHIASAASNQTCFALPELSTSIKRHVPTAN